MKSNWQLFIEQLRNTKNIYEARKVVNFFLEHHPIVRTQEEKVFKLIKGASEWATDNSFKMFIDDVIYWDQNLEEF